MGLCTVLVIGACLTIFQVNFSQSRGINAPATRAQRSIRYTSVWPHPNAHDELRYRRNAIDPIVTAKRYIPPSVTVKVPLNGPSSPDVIIKIVNSSHTEVKELPNQTYGDNAQSPDNPTDENCNSAESKANSDVITVDTNTETITATVADSQMINGEAVAEAAVGTEVITTTTETETLTNAEDTVAEGCRNAESSGNSGDSSANNKGCENKNIAKVGVATDTITETTVADSITEAVAIANGNDTTAAEAAATAAAVSGSNGSVTSTASSSASGSDAYTASATETTTNTTGTDTISATFTAAEGEDASATAAAAVENNNSVTEGASNGSAAVSETATYSEPIKPTVTSTYSDSFGDATSSNIEQPKTSPNPEAEPQKENNPEEPPKSEVVDSD